MTSSFFPQREQPIHLLLTCVAAAGHINPLVQLAHCLVEPRANKPTCYVTLGILTDSNTRGKVHLPQHDRIRVFSEQEFDITKWIENIEAIDQHIAEEMTPRVIQTHLHWPSIDAVVFDFISTFGQQIAQKLKVPSFTYLASPLFCFWSIVRHDALTALRKQDEPPKSYTIPGIGDFTLLPGEEDDEKKGVWDKLCRVCVEAYKKADGCLANDVQSWYSNDFIASLPPSPLPSDWKVLCCGPLALKDPRLTAQNVDASIDDVNTFASQFPPRSILYIALGSCWSLKNQDLVELVRGIAATGRPFIFAHRGKNVDDPFAAFGPKDTPALEATEEDGLPVGYRDEISGRGLIVKWVNQPRLLGHPSIGAFMTHCGWNSIMEGMAFGGVPYLLLPIGGDQQANAEFLNSHLKCGKLVKGFAKDEPLQRDKICEVIEEIFNDQDLKDQAQRLHQLVRQESVENGVSEMNLMKFFDRITESKVVS